MSELNTARLSVDIQSVIYGNAPYEILAAVESTAHAAQTAVLRGEIGSWRLILGDCSPQQFASDAEISAMRDVVSAAGGVLTFLFFDENLGSAAGHNRLAKEGDGDRIVILNPDAKMAYDTLVSLSISLRSGVGIVESRQIPLEHPRYFEESTGDTSWASTACAMTPRHVFNEVSGFDAESFFLYCDDVDYSWRVRLAGYRVVFEPSARLFHDKRLDLNGDWPASSAEIYYSAEAAMMLAHKYSRPDLAEALERQFSASPVDGERRAATEFARRKDAGLLAAPVDPRHRVAEFVNGNYAPHRF